VNFQEVINIVQELQDIGVSVSDDFIREMFIIEISSIDQSEN